jgi:hypothetical protein
LEIQMPDWKDQIKRRLVALKLEPTREEEIVEELTQHLEQRYAEVSRRSNERRGALRLFWRSGIAPGGNRGLWRSFVLDHAKVLRDGVRMAFGATPPAYSGWYSGRVSD